MKRYAWLFILCLGILLRLAPVFTGKTLIFGDNVSLLVPVKLYSAYWLNQGIIPWWNPTIFAGVPWAEDISQSVFYPSTIIFALLNPAHALNATIALHLIFTGFGMYLLGKKLFENDLEASLSSVLWTFSPQVTYSINNLSTIQSIAWFPWVVLGSLNLTKKKWGRIIFGLLILAQFMAGYPQHVLYSIMTTVLLDVYLSKKNREFKLRTWMLTWMITGLIVLGITAVAWFPFVRVLSESTRSIQDARQAMVGSLDPRQLPKIIIPYIFDLPLAGFRWGPAYAGFPQALFYFGLPGLAALGIFLRKNRYWLIVFGSLFLFSLGSYLPGFSKLFEILPMLKFARYPSMAMIPITFFASLYIPSHLFSLVKHAVINKALKLFPVAIFLSFSLMIVLMSLQNFSSIWNKTDDLFGNALSLSSFHTLERDHKIVQVIISDFVLIMLFSWLTLLALRGRRYILVVLFIALDIIVHTQGVLFFGPKNIFPTWKELEVHQQKSIQSGPQSRAITNNSNQPYIDFGSYWEEMSIRKPFSNSAINDLELHEANRLTQLINTHTPNWNMPFNLPIINGYTTLLPKDFAALWQTSNDPRINFIDYIDLKNPLLKEWSVDTLLVDNQFDPEKQFSNYPLMNELDSISTYHLDALPRIRYTNDADIEISSFQETPNTITLEFDNLRNQQSIIIADRYDKNWQALINGKETEIINDSGMRNIPIEPGANSVRLRYIPLEFIQGLYLSLLSFGVYGFIVMFKYRRSYGK